MAYELLMMFEFLIRWLSTIFEICNIYEFDLTLWQNVVLGKKNWAPYVEGQSES